MRDEGTVSRATRIVVSFDTTALGEAALEAALGLAAVLNAEIAGLFVEDIGLVRMASLPFTRELGLTSAVLRPIDAGDIERALRLQAEQSRAWLAAAAGALNLRWSFQVVRGQAVGAVLEYGEGSTLVVLGTSSASVVSASMEFSAPGAAERRAFAPGRFRRLGARPIVMLFDGSERAMRALAAAHALAKRAYARLTVLVMADDAEEFERLRRQARSWLAEQGAAARFIGLKSRDVESVAQAVSAENASAFLWHEKDEPADPRALRRLLSELSCPLILVS